MSGTGHRANRDTGYHGALSLMNVGKKIGRKDIVRGLSLDVYPGEIFGFLGPNGAGKTTTIRMMVGLMECTSGDIRINGFSIRKQKNRALKHVGVIVENPEMYKYLSGYHNLLHFARMIPGIKKARIEETIRLVGLEDRIHDKVKTYSLGMRQRLGVAQALLHKPSVLILDEPTNGLDPAGIRELRDYLKKLAHVEGIAVVVSSHLLSEMELMCDRVAIIQHGELIEIQSIDGGKQNENGMRVFFEVDRPEEAAKHLLQAAPQAVVGIQANGVLVEAEKESISSMNRTLVHAGVKVYAMNKIQKSLEDKFLEVTRRKA